MFRHQAIAECFVSTLFNLHEPLHGVASSITILKDDYLFANIPPYFNIGHYHSWAVSHDMPDHVEILAKHEQSNIMVIRHKVYDVHGVQFHPESILTEFGKPILGNWLKQ